MKKINLIELIIDEVDDEHQFGVDIMSLVKSPAMDEHFLMFNSQKKETKNHYQLAKTNDEKRIITGAALIPNKSIFRRDELTGEEFYVYFTKQTVQKIVEKFFIQNKQSNVNLEHQTSLEDLTIIESWIVTDSDNDKSNALGLKAPVGTWMISMKINNNDVWEKYIKKGAVSGFSIEGFFTEKFSKAAKSN